MVHPSSTFAAVNNYVELKKYKIMAGLFLMFVMTIALGSLLNDYVQSVSDSDDSEPKPSIVFTPDDDNTDWQKDGE